MEKKVTVIIPNYNGLKFMEPCMAALKGQTSQEFDVLVVDNGSTDGSAEWLKAHQIPGIFLKEKITPVKIASTILCLVGAYIAMQPSFDSNPFPLLAALLAAVVSGMAYTMLSYCKNFTHPSAIIFHFSALSTVCAGLMMLPNLVIPSPKVFVMLLLIGVFAAGGQFFLTYAYQQAPASEVSIYQYSGVVFTAVFSYAFLGETLGKSSIIGGIVILGAIFWVFENTRKEKNT